MRTLLTVLAILLPFAFPFTVASATNGDIGASSSAQATVSLYIPHRFRVQPVSGFPPEQPPPGFGGWIVRGGGFQIKVTDGPPGTHVAINGQAAAVGDTIYSNSAAAKIVPLAPGSRAGHVTLLIEPVL